MYLVSIALFISCILLGEGKKNKSLIAVGIPSEIILPGKFTEEDMQSGGIFAALIPPNGTETPCFLKRLPNGNGLGKYNINSLPKLM